MKTKGTNSGLRRIAVSLAIACSLLLLSGPVLAATTINIGPVTIIIGDNSSASPCGPEKP